jgi:NADPH-dependent 2,4-dienoyl-CoA reductase/sulfur reductase-like enzyme
MDALADRHARLAVAAPAGPVPEMADRARPSIGNGDTMHSDVLIIGAGPTGLVLALWLTKLGVKVRIADKTAEPGTTSRALAVHARTLELYRQLDLAASSWSMATRFPRSICG